MGFLTGVNVAHTFSGRTTRRTLACLSPGWLRSHPSGRAVTVGRAFILSTAQCSRGINQSRPYPARSLKIMESAGHYAKPNGASPEGWYDLGKETKRHQAASGITLEAPGQWGTR